MAWHCAVFSEKKNQETEIGLKVVPYQDSRRVLAAAARLTLNELAAFRLGEAGRRAR